jgi:hypothetical protein
MHHPSPKPQSTPYRKRHGVWHKAVLYAMEHPMALYSIEIADLARKYDVLLSAECADAPDQVQHYRQGLACLSEAYLGTSAVPSRPLTIPAIFGRTYHENFLSDYLAYILDPAKNGIGTAPLACFLALAGCDVSDVSLDEVIVQREYPVGAGRIDRLLEWPTLVVGIENKILSLENGNQTKYYARHIGQQFKDTPSHFVYLTRDGHEATSLKFVPLSWQQLLDALRPVPGLTGTGARPMVLWYDFLEHLEVYITISNSEAFEFSDKARLYIEHQPMLRDLTGTFRKEWSAAVDFLERALQLHHRVIICWAAVG